MGKSHAMNKKGKKFLKELKERQKKIKEDIKNEKTRTN